jgi:hypothetical protein
MTVNAPIRIMAVNAPIRIMTVNAPIRRIKAVNALLQPADFISKASENFDLIWHLEAYY